VAETDPLVDAMVAAMLSNDPDQVAALYSEDCRILDPAMEVTGKQGLLDAVTYFFSAFRMTDMSVDEVARSDSSVVIRSHWTAVHQGEYLGVAPSGVPFDTWNVMWLGVADGLIVSDTSVWDAGELRRLEELSASTVRS
jgi:steroid delta-isomerase-like uncharacterized protein